jgi:hypothetical protein
MTMSESGTVTRRQFLRTTTLAGASAGAAPLAAYASSGRIV